MVGAPGCSPVSTPLNPPLSRGHESEDRDHRVCEDILYQGRAVKEAKQDI